MLLGFVPCGESGNTVVTARGGHRDGFEVLLPSSDVSNMSMGR